MDAISTLVQHWRQLDLGAASRVHQADQAAMSGVSGFDLSATPYPYVGDILRADVWILMLNSNIGPDDQRQETEPYFAERLRANITQNLDNYEYRMLSLDPKLEHTGTYAYYNHRNGLAKLVTALAKRSRITEHEARKQLASRLAVIQLFPYRSTSGVPPELLSSVRSVQIARQAAREALNSKLVVVPRSAPQWGFCYGVREGNLFTFRADQARSASLMPGGACGGGDAILERLLS